MRERALKQSIPPVTLVETARRWAREKADQRAYTFLEDGEREAAVISFADLDRRARALAARLQSSLSAGERALLLYPAGLDFITAFFGCLYCGVVAVPAYPPQSAKSLPRLRSVSEDAQPAVVLTTAAMKPKLASRTARVSALRDSEMLATDELSDELADGWTDPGLGASDLAFLQYTSGSTGSPKGVMVSHGNLVHNLSDIRSAFGHCEDTILGSWLPLYHDMGLIGNVLQSFYVGVPCILMSPLSFLQRPSRWLAAISRYRITTSGGPNFAYDLCVKKIAPEHRQELDLSSWTVAFNGAEPVHARTMERFTRAFEPCGFRPQAHYPCYGLAEATVFVTGGVHSVAPAIGSFDAAELEVDRVRGSESAAGRVLVSCGRPWQSQRVVIVDPKSHALCRADQVGEIWTAGRSVAGGYWKRPEATRHDFQAMLAEPCEDGFRGPFLRTGDLGFQHQGELFITGRLKDLIILRGRNLYPQDIELAVEQAHPALQSGSAAAFSIEDEDEERLVVVCAVSSGRATKPSVCRDILKAVRRAVAQQQEAELYSAVLIRPGSVLKTTSGKIQRRACKAAYLAGELKVVGEWIRSAAPQALDEQLVTGEEAPSVPHSQEALAQWLVEHLVHRLGIPRDQVDLRSPFADYGLASSSAVELSASLQQALGRKISPTLLYEYSNIRSLAEYLAGEAPTRQARPAATRTSGMVAASEIAVVGVGCRFPGAAGPEAFWQLLKAGTDAVTEVPAERWNVEALFDPQPARPGKMNTRWGGFLDQLDRFDADFFGISPIEAARMDPQQRLLLEVAWEALENAGEDPDRLAGSYTGVFVGISGYDYGQLQLRDSRLLDSYVGTGSALSMAANRLSYFLDLRGPSLAVDTACSSSLVALHQAVRSLRSGECDMALAGGVNLILSPEPTIGFSQARMLAADGRCKTFDAAADGYVRGEGCGVVVLKPLAAAVANGDTVLALVRGSALNQDGRSNGLTAPNGRAQQEVVRRALADAGVAPAAVDYVEAHGTGTPLGDPIELQALGAVLSEGRSAEQRCRVGSVKTNIGHLEAAAGIAGLIKAVLMLHYGEVPPHLHLTELNPKLGIDELPLAIPTRLQPWPRGERERYAGVSSFGFGGTNAHVVLAEAPAATAAAAPVPPREQLFVLSARNEGTLRELARRYGSHLADHPEIPLQDLCFTALDGRRRFTHRLAATPTSGQRLAQDLREFADGGLAAGIASGCVSLTRRPKIAFLFTGQGSQYRAMGRELYDTEPVFRQTLERCDELLRPHLDPPLLAVLYPEEAGDGVGPTSLLDQTAYTQPALFALEIGLVELWRSWGVEPDAVFGHSLGEYAAACVAGVLSLEDGLRLVAERGRLMQELPGGGLMASVTAPEERVEAAVAHHAREVSVAAFNGPHGTVISGARGPVETILEELAGEGFKARRLRVSHAFHSPAMDPILDPFERWVSGLALAPPRIPLVCDLTGEPAAPDVVSAAYWRDQLRRPVRFAAGVGSLWEIGCRIFLEIGPSPALAAMGRHCLPEDETSWLPSLRRRQGDRLQLLKTLGALWLRGVEIDAAGLFSHSLPRRIALPSYPFERRRYWLDSHVRSDAATGDGAGVQAGTVQAGTVQAGTVQAGTGPSRQHSSLSRSSGQAAGTTSAAPAAGDLRRRLEQAPVGRARDFLVAYMQEQLAQLMGFDTPRQVDTERGLFDMGVDSLMALEMKNRLQVGLEVVLPSSLIFDYPSLAALASHLCDEVLSLGRPSVDPPPDSVAGARREETGVAEAREIETLAEELEQLSEHQTEALLLEKLRVLEVTNG